MGRSCSRHTACIRRTEPTKWEGYSPKLKMKPLLSLKPHQFLRSDQIKCQQQRKTHSRPCQWPSARAPSPSAPVPRSSFPLKLSHYLQWPWTPRLSLLHSITTFLLRNQCHQSQIHSGKIGSLRLSCAGTGLSTNASPTTANLPMVKKNCKQQRGPESRIVAHSTRLTHAWAVKGAISVTNTATSMW